MSVHQPVMVEEVISYWMTDPAGVYVDATVGGGGHAVRLVEELESTGRLIGLDRDPAAIELAAARLQSFGARIDLVDARASQMRSVLTAQGIEKVDGVLLDLGLSSDQLASVRGFAFSSEGTLDLRFDPRDDAVPAHELLRRLSAAEIAGALREFGEFKGPESRRIAAALSRSAAAGTSHVRDFVTALEPHVHVERRARSLARVFQTLRILVNDELRELERALESARDVLRAGGVLCVISYHSLEDRMVKRFMTPKVPPVPELPPPDDWPEPAFELLTRRAVRPSDREIAQNPRARSARLRAARRSDT